MTAIEACELLADSMREFAAARADRDAWRLLALQALHHGHQMHVETERLRADRLRLLAEYRALREQVNATRNLPDRVTSNQVVA